MSNIKPKYCSPTHNNNPYTCFSDSALLKLASAYNRKYPDKIKLPENRPDGKKSQLPPSARKVIWDSLRSGLQKSDELPCDQDYCILETPLGRSIRDNEIHDETFRPEKPESWYIDDHTWLTNFDIEGVMRQYEADYPDFAFLGPSPIDFDSKELFSDRCIEDSICKLNLSAMLSKGKTRIGIVFNLDPHDRPGSHWTALMCDIANGGIYYFDSNGTQPPKEVVALMHRLRDQGNELIMKDKIQTSQMKPIHRHPLKGKLVNPNTFRINPEGGSQSNNTSGLNVKVGDICHLMDGGAIVDNTRRRVKEIQDNNTIIFDEPFKPSEQNRVNSDTQCKLVRRDFEELYNPEQFQRQNTECGMFSMYFLIQYIEGRNFFEIIYNKIHDDEVWKNRDRYFRPNVSQLLESDKDRKSKSLGIFGGSKKRSLRFKRQTKSRVGSKKSKSKQNSRKKSLRKSRK
jgi:hypothetical protein